MKNQISSVLLGFATICTFLSAASIALATNEDQFNESGSADVVSPASAAEESMLKRAQAHCAPGTSARQKTPTVYEFVPRAFPVSRIASAEFVCEIPAEGQPQLRQGNQFIRLHQANETVRIRGFAFTTSAAPFSCDIALPIASDAIINANQKATQYCAADNLVPKQVSPFIESRENCRYGGFQYHWASDYVYEEAQYKCVSIN